MNSLFRFCMLSFPREFRERYGAEMTAVFNERSLHGKALSAVGESLDAVTAGTRMRLESTHFRHSAAVMAFVAVMIMTTIALHDVRPAKPAGRIDFSAHDAGGLFTLTLIDGRPVAATMDNISLSSNRIVARGDSVKLMTKDGRTAIALALDAKNGTISWNSREGGER